MATTRAEDLYISVRNDFNILESQIDNVQMALLMTKVIEAYSRFRGIRAIKEITFIEDTQDYELAIDIFYVEDVLFNETYPSESNYSGMTQEVKKEYIDWPSLKIIDQIKIIRSQDIGATEEQDYIDYYSTDTTPKHMLHIEPQPETNIIVIYRKLLGINQFGESDKEAITKFLQAKVLQYCKGHGILVSMGSITFDNAGIDKKVKELEGYFYSWIAGSYMERS